jgi:hypothetical protein
MTESNELYLCSSCRNRIEAIDDVLLVEDHYPRGFCSEMCIEEYFKPVINMMKEEDKSWRSKFSIAEIPSQEDELYNESLALTMESPDEIFLQRNELGEEIYYFFKKISENEVFALACLVFEHSPSFLFYHTLENKPEIIEQLKTKGEKIGNIEPYLTGGKGVLEGHDEQENREDFFIDADTYENIKRKRSTFLAELVELRSETDIPMEEFYLYEHCLNKTLEKPDEIFCFKDKEDDDILVYIRSFEQDQISYFYLILCFQIEDQKGEEEKVLMPIISFPSLDGALYQQYKKGEQLAGPLKS